MPEPSYQDKMSNYETMQNAPVTIIEAWPQLFRSLFAMQKAQAQIQAEFAQQSLQQLGQVLTENQQSTQQQRGLFGSGTQQHVQNR